jgi:hypothetical protein
VEEVESSRLGTPEVPKADKGNRIKKDTSMTTFRCFIRAPWNIQGD